MGEVENRSSINTEFIKVIADVFDGGQTFIGTDFTYAHLGVLPPGEKTCFDIPFPGEPANWSIYQLSTTFSEGGQTASGLSIFDDSGAPNSLGYRVIGFATNQGAQRAEFVKVVGTLYDGAGNVIDCDYGYVNSTHLEPGQTSAFKVWFLGRDYASVSSYRLQVQGVPDQPTSPAPTGLAFLTNHSWYTTTVGALHIVGEVSNPMTTTIKVDAVTANILDGAGHLLETGDAFVSTVLPAGDRTCFDVSTDQPVAWSSYQFEGTYFSEGESAPDLALLSSSISTNSLGYPEISGQIRNDGSNAAENVRGIATLYDANGKAIGCEYDFVNSTDLNPGATSSFKITFWGENFSGYDDYRLQVRGRPAQLATAGTATPDAPGRTEDNSATGAFDGTLYLPSLSQ